MSRHRKIRRRWLRGVAWAVVGTFGAAVVAGAVTVRVDNLRFEPVLSGSMRPGIQPGDLAIVRPVPVGHLRVGNVVAYLPPDQTTLVMHRIVSLDPQGMITKGDANPVTDPWGRAKPTGTSVERLVVVVPKLGWLVQVKRQLLTALAMVLLLAVAAALWVNSSHKSHAARSRLRRITTEAKPTNS